MNSLESRYSHLQSVDIKNIWHPFTQHSLWGSEIEPLVIERGEGNYLYDARGTAYLDGVSSLWCNVHGHSVPELTAAIKEQADLLCHSTLLGLTHVPIVELSERLFEILPSHFAKAFYADAGTTAVEAGLRIAMEWWQKSGQPSAGKRTKFASLVGGYHGDTLGAIGVGYLEEFHGHLDSLVTPALRVNPPHVYRFMEGMSEEEALAQSVSQLKGLFDSHGHELAAFIFEPMVQGAAGIWTHPKEFMLALADLCEQHGVLLIADEVAVGFGKTGTMFAIEQGPIAPDIMILGKGLSAGYLPISCAVVSEKMYQGFIGAPSEGKTFFYGQTFAGNPLAARVAAANLDLFKTSGLMTQLPGRLAHFSKELETRIEPLAHVDEIRNCGVMTAIELTEQAGERVAFDPEKRVTWQIIQRAREAGAIIRPLGNVIILMPPLTMPEAELSKLVSITADAIRASTEG